MKRMTDNPMNYYTVKAEDLTDVVPKGSDLYEYTPSPEFLDVLNNFKSALIIDWEIIGKPISLAIGAKLSVVYPTAKPYILDEESPTGYCYCGDTFSKQVRTVFYYLNGKHQFNLKIS